jgi:hypothetical protein
MEEYDMALMDKFRRNKPQPPGTAKGSPDDTQRMMSMLNEPPQGDMTPEADNGERVPTITDADVRRLEDVLLKYKSGKTVLENRIIENEQWFKMKHWDYIRGNREQSLNPEPTSAYLFNAIANKHADFMDNYPEITALPREPEDQSDAELLTDVLPVLYEQNDFRSVYSDVAWYKLKFGTGVYGQFFNARKMNGLGDIDIRKGDMLSLFWEPGIADIQRSRYMFGVDTIDNELLAQQFPKIKHKLSSSPTLDVAKFIYTDNVDTSGKSVIVDCYYHVSKGYRDLLHYIKFCNGTLLYASENDPNCDETGFYNHGMYPYVFDVLFPEEGSPAGFGYIDVAKNPQMYVDKLDQYIMMAAARAANPKFFRKGSGNVNIEEYNDPSKTFVTVDGTGDPRESVFPVPANPVDSSAVQVRMAKIDELKENASNRDYNQGGTTKGVTSGVALATLQEAGNKLSRDMIAASFSAYEKLNLMSIKNLGQFYTEDRMFRVIGKDGAIKFASINGQRLSQKPQGSAYGIDLGYREPIFDIKVRAQRSSPYSAATENDRAMQLYTAGFFRPDNADQALGALDMMTFEGIEQMRQRIQQNGTLYQKLQQLAPLVLAMAQQLDALQGTQYTAQVAQILGLQMQQGQTGSTQGGKAMSTIQSEGSSRVQQIGAARAQVGGAA